MEVSVIAKSTIAVRKSTGGEGRKTSGIVGFRRVGHSASIVAGGGPSRGVGQRLGNIAAVAAAPILALAAHIVGQLGPFGIARHVPAHGADTLWSVGT